MLHNKHTINFISPSKEVDGGRAGFTLVELIVVVTILAILSTIGFVSYSSYLTGVRDTNRLAQLVSIHDGLELYRTKNDLPLPDRRVAVQANGTTVAYQGYAGSNTLETIDFTKGGKDPKDDEYFTYFLTKDRKYFQLMGFLEEAVGSTTNRILPSLYATDYSNRNPTVYGKKLGILTDNDNTPIQEISAITTLGFVNFDGTGLEYVAHIDDGEEVSSSGAIVTQRMFAISVGRSYSNCNDILTKNPSLVGLDGLYWISLSGGEQVKTECDMTTEGGGWTMVWHGYPSEARYMLKENEHFSISSNLPFNNMMMRMVNINHYITDTLTSDAILKESIPYYFDYVSNLPDSSSPNTLFHSNTGQNVSLQNQRFMYGYGNSRRYMHGCINVNANHTLYLGAGAGSCPLRSSFAAADVGCISSGSNYCNNIALNDSPKDSGLGLSLKEYQETKVFIK